MNILMVGGGSGGHVTPLKAVTKQLKALDDQLHITVVTDRKYSKQAAHIFADFPEIKMKAIFAGKIRRYHGKSILWHVFHFPTLLMNIRDVGYLFIGFLQSVWYLTFNRPKVIFSKGGFVALPIGIAGALLRIPIVIHDSDTHPGLTSRILSKRAKIIATGMPPQYYPYSPEKMKHTGIPVDTCFKPIGESARRQLKNELGLDDSKPLLLVVGGGTGAKRLNEAVEAQAESLLKQSWSIAHITGPGKAEAALKVRQALAKEVRKHWVIHEFTDISLYLLACDIALVRTGATTMQELANAQKTVITVPSPYLSGGHQLKNAEAFEAKHATFVLDESAIVENPQAVVEAVERVYADNALMIALAENLHRHFAKPNAAQDLALLVQQAATQHKTKDLK